MNLSFGEIALILIVLLVLFGGKKIPQVGAAFGKAINNFKKGMNNDKDDQA